MLCKKSFFSDETYERRRGGCWLTGGAAAPEREILPIQKLFTFLHILFRIGYESGPRFSEK